MIQFTNIYIWIIYKLMSPINIPNIFECSNKVFYNKSLEVFIISLQVWMYIMSDDVIIIIIINVEATDI